MLKMYYCEYEDCSAKYEKINSLRRHSKRRHSKKVSILKRKQLSDEERKGRQRKYTAKCRENKKLKRKVSRCLRKTLYSYIGPDEADTRGTFGCINPLLEYKKSKIEGAGNGVFALQNFQTGEIVTWFSGDVSDSPPKDGSYSIDLFNGLFFNCIKNPVEGCGLGSFVNREERKIPKSRKNCVIVQCENEKHRVYIEITRPVKVGDELYTTYSHGYRIPK